MDEIPKLSGEINYNKSIYYFTTPGIAPINFIKLKETRDRDKTVQEKE